MLNLYIGYPPRDKYKGIVYNPDSHFKDLDLYEIMSTDFSMRVAKECSDIASFESPILMKTNSGRYVSPLDLSSGAKNVLLMKYTNKIVDMLWCGDNCDKFVEEIAREKDLIVFTTRDYVPYERSESEDFRVLNSGKIYHSSKEYLFDLDISDFFEEMDEDE